MEKITPNRTEGKNSEIHKWYSDVPFNIKRQTRRTLPSINRGYRSLNINNEHSGSDNNHWSVAMEDVARQTMQQATGYAWMYEKLVASSTRWGNAISIISGILAGAIGTEGLISAILSNKDNRTSFSVGIITALVGYIITILIVLDNNWKLDVIKSEGLVAHVGFIQLSRSIKLQLTLQPSERNDAREFVQNILIEIDKMKLSSPTIPNSIKNSYSNKVKNNPIYNPEEQLRRRTTNQFRRNVNGINQSNLENMLANYEKNNSS